MPKRYMPFFIHHRRNHLANDQALVLLLSTHTCAQPRGRVGGRENRNEEVFRGRVTRYEDVFHAQHAHARAIEGTRMHSCIGAYLQRVADDVALAIELIELLRRIV